MQPCTVVIISGVSMTTEYGTAAFLLKCLAKINPLPGSVIAAHKSSPVLLCLVAASLLLTLQHVFSMPTSHLLMCTNTDMGVHCNFHSVCGFECGDGCLYAFVMHTATHMSQLENTYHVSQCPL